MAAAGGGIAAGYPVIAATSGVGVVLLAVAMRGAGLRRHPSAGGQRENGFLLTARRR